MIKTVKMPSFGSDMAKGMVAEWRVKPGDTVHRGDVIATIETMKGLIDLEVFDEGVVEALLAPVGQQRQVGEPIAHLRLAGEAETAEVVEQSPEQAVEPDAIKAMPAPAQPKPAAGAMVRISPAARQRADNGPGSWGSTGGPW
ncbi:hypothetical protein UN63_15420, partial [Oceanisphaera arctica]